MYEGSGGGECFKPVAFHDAEERMTNYFAVIWAAR